MTPKLKKIIMIGIIAVILVAALAVCVNLWTARKMDKVALGLAKSFFPYRDYTEEELNKMYPQIKYADVPTRITPEETYVKFRQALKENNLEMVIEQLDKESDKYRENKEILTNFYNENKFQELYQFYPEKIIQANIYESIAQYYYLRKEGEYNLRQYINFAKDANGDWKLDSL